MECSGVSTVVSQLANRLAQEDGQYNVRIITVGGTAVVQDPRVAIDFIDPFQFGVGWGLLPRVYKKIVDIIREHNISLVHVHGVWRLTNLAGLVAASKCNIPVILSSHGMLEKWLWKEQGFIKKHKKIIYFNLVFQKMLPHNLVLHAITSREKETLESYFPGKRIATIPNAINMGFEDKRVEVNTVDTTIVFLGRLHPVKGIELLLEAFFVANLSENWKVQVIGPEEDQEYVNHLKELVREKNMQNRVVFLGAVYGEEKFQLLKRAWVLVMPSYSEVIGMVNLEAALCNTPSITTYETGLEDWEKGGGLLIHPEVNQLKDALLKVSQWSNVERIDIGEQSFDFVMENFSWDVVFSRWKELYSGLIGSKGRCE